MKPLSWVVLKGDSTSHHPKSDVESQPQSDSGEEATEQIESSRKSPVDEERHPLLPPTDVMKNTKYKSKYQKRITHVKVKLRQGKKCQQKNIP
jgi:hypothetical protein